MKVTVIIDKVTCIGSQTCVIEDGEHFGLDANDRAVVRKDVQSKWQRKVVLDITKEQQDKMVTIAQLCPTRAIRVLDEQGNQLFPKL